MTAEALPPGSVIGIVGGGQLGRMLAQAAAKLGLRASIFAPEDDSPAFDVAALHHCARYDDVEALERFAKQADAVTFEFENIPAESLAVIERHTRLSPPRLALEVAQDRRAERWYLIGLGLPVAPFAEVWPERGDASQAIAEARDILTSELPGAALFLKRARLGYDGKGQMRIEAADELYEATSWLGDAAAVLEREVPFKLELSVLCVRDSQGGIRCYDPPHNVHRGGILRESFVPAPISPEIGDLAQTYAGRIAHALDYVGVLAVEMFLIGEGSEQSLLINEVAPRVHNSGHWTLDACAVSQFENHIRAVAGWPLGATDRHSDARLVNLLGAEADNWRTLLQDHPERSLTLYGKNEGRPGRKMGHYVDLSPKADRRRVSDPHPPVESL